jgi:hypothetical protein
VYFTLECSITVGLPVQLLHSLFDTWGQSLLAMIQTMSDHDWDFLNIFSERHLKSLAQIHPNKIPSTKRLSGAASDLTSPPTSLHISQFKILYFSSTLGLKLKLLSQNHCSRTLRDSDLRGTLGWRQNNLGSPFLSVLISFLLL